MSAAWRLAPRPRPVSRKPPSPPVLLSSSQLTVWDGGANRNRNRSGDDGALIRSRLEPLRYSDRLDGAVDLRGCERPPRKPLGRPMVAGADRLDPLARVRGARSVDLEAERMKRIPETAIDELQKAELRRGKDAAAQPRLAQRAHQPRRREEMPAHRVKGRTGDRDLGQNPIGDPDRLCGKGQRAFRPGG